VDDAAPVALGQVAVVLGDKVARLIGGDGVDLERGGVAVAQGGGELFEQGVFVAQGAAEIDDGLDQPLGVLEGPVREEGFVDRGGGVFFVEQGPLGIVDVGAHGLEEGAGFVAEGEVVDTRQAGRALPPRGRRFPALLAHRGFDEVDEARALRRDHAIDSLGRVARGRPRSPGGGGGVEDRGWGARGRHDAG
jgi:hypothetical protein